MTQYNLLTFFLFFFFLSPIIHVTSSCADFNYCNGHGKCNSLDYCDCWEGWTNIDCSERICPFGTAWGDLPSSITSAHAEAECSNQGKCNRQTGTCVCFEGFTGSSCQRLACPNNCSGHGKCKSLRKLANDLSAQPAAWITSYDSSVSPQAWDADVIYGCVCDSVWPVGLEPNQEAVAEWFGPDCSLRRCPSNNNPITFNNELDCTKKYPTYGHIISHLGNKCHVDCSNQGICDYTTGTCKCFPGYSGIDCSFSPYKDHNATGYPTLEDDDYYFYGPR